MSLFYQKFGKRMIDLSLSSLGVLFLWPALFIIGFLVKLDSPGPMIYRQKRIGQNGRVFAFYKFRTMIVNAEKIRTRYGHLNEADGPVFKIRDDPRYTRVGKILSHTGLDELPQLVNVFLGQMSLVGPRPLPVTEGLKIPEKWRNQREKVRPGITSSWLTKGAHNLSFTQWMDLDLDDIKKSSALNDLKILSQTILLSLTFLKKEILK